MLPERPKGSKNKTTLQLREAILKALDDVGGAKYLATLAVENSSAFASLLGKVLPTTLTADESDGGDKQITFRRIIVHAGDVTPPKQIAAPASPTLPRDDEIVVAPKEIKDL